MKMRARCSAIAIAAVVAVLVLLTATGSSAQTFRGSIAGTVTDTSGAAVTGATVTVHNIATGVDRITQTGIDGGYLVPELQVGAYDVTIELGGFQKAVTKGVSVDVATERRVDVVLKPGADHVPEKSGWPSRVRGAGADRFALPSLVRGMPGVG